MSANSNTEYVFLLEKTFCGVGFFGTGRLTLNNGSILLYRDSSCWPTVVNLDCVSNWVSQICQMDSYFFLFPNKEHRTGQRHFNLPARNPSLLFHQGQSVPVGYHQILSRWQLSQKSRAFWQQLCPWLKMMHTATSVLCLLLGCDEDQNKGKFMPRTWNHSRLSWRVIRLYPEQEVNGLMSCKC